MWRIWTNRDRALQSGVAVFALVSGLLVVHRMQQRPASTGRKITPTESLRAPITDFRVPVLMYHRINDDAIYSSSPLLRDLTVSVGEFQTQMRYLRDNQFQVLSSHQVEEAVRLKRALPEKSVVVTLDDGYKDNFDHAFPALRECGFPATIFLVTSTVGTPNHLSWEDVLLMKKDSVTYGSHTIHHYDLTHLAVSQLDYELTASKRQIEYRTAERVCSIAYPSGRYNDLVKERARDAGYLAGWKKGGGPVSPESDPLLLPRLRVHGRTSLPDFTRKVNSGLLQRRFLNSSRES